MKSKQRKPATHPIEQEQVLEPQESIRYFPMSETLTSSEMEQLRCEAKEDNAFFQRAFAHLKRK